MARPTITLHAGVALFAEEVWDRRRVAYHVDRNGTADSTYSFATAVARDRAIKALRTALDAQISGCVAVRTAVLAA